MDEADAEKADNAGSKKSDDVAESPKAEAGPAAESTSMAVEAAAAALEKGAGTQPMDEDDGEDDDGDAEEPAAPATLTLKAVDDSPGVRPMPRRRAA